ncbi:hypothetical protein BDY17DRAFT_306148 [Neohortaea acidophila]|uniref:Histidine phosphatase superfamily n=1 Tax=Neohortaea acidophila TaxID=245834 RepID=A0A6A6PFK5_9PEZI|nr:uncharacterized protein BDY17DRAFT_306148 [Neohortaea acidophila]KAF2478501.1 hypothetical protein BDY17DRAFT_306148 [Neohortaea acidophila]
MRCAIQTAQYCFENVLPKTDSRRVFLLPDAQEITDLPCDIGSAPAAITHEFGELVDTRMVAEDWTSKKGKYGTDPESLQEWARRLRRWLRDQPEAEIVVVSQAGFLEYVTGSNLDDNGELRDFVSGWKQFLHFSRR